MTLLERVARGAVWSFLSTWGQLIISLGVLVVMARMLGPEPYGLNAMVWVIIGFGHVFVGGSLAESVIQREKLEPGHVDTTFWTSLIIAAVLFTLVTALRGPLADVFEAPILGHVIPASALSLFIWAAGSVPQSILERALRYRAIAAAGLAGTAIGGGVGIVLALTDYGVWSLVALNLATAAARTAIIWWQARWRPGRAANLEYARQLGRFNLSVVGIRLLQYVEDNIPRAVIGLVLGPVALGHFSFAYRLFDMLQKVLILPITSVALPAVARARINPGIIPRLILSAIRITGLLAAPAFLGLAAIAPILIPVAFGGQWKDSVLITQVLASIGVVEALAVVNGAVLRAFGRPHWQLAQNVLGAAFMCVAVPSVMTFGPVAVAAVLVLRRYAIWPIGAALVARLTGVSSVQQITEIMPALAMALVMMGVVTAWLWSVTVTPFLQLVGGLALGVVVYPAGLLVVSGQTRRIVRTLMAALMRRDWGIVRGAFEFQVVLVGSGEAAGGEPTGGIPAEQQTGSLGGALERSRIVGMRRRCR